MLKRLPFLFAALFALAACSSNPGDSAPAATPPAAEAATAPATPEAAAPAAVTEESDNAPAAASSIAPVAAEAAEAPAAESSAPPPAPFVDNGEWVQGKHYFVIEPQQPTAHPDQIEVTEVFSYACPACNTFHSTANEIARTLPAGAVMNYLPASFRTDENWPLFQRAYFTAQALGVEREAHDAMFDAVWVTGELSYMDPKTGRPKPQSDWATIDTVAKFYAKFGADPKEFEAVAKSFTVNTKMKQADDLIKAYGVDSTPSIVVNGKYRFSAGTAGSLPKAIELTQWLVSKEAAGK